MPEVFLIGKDWKTRALVRAQLLEEGVEVEASETVMRLGGRSLRDTNPEGKS